MFFFSSRRRHTRSLCDWSSDVCSSDLGSGASDARDRVPVLEQEDAADQGDLRSEERRVGKSVDLGGRRIIKKKKKRGKGKMWNKRLKKTTIQPDRERGN